MLEGNNEHQRIDDISINCIFYDMVFSKRQPLDKFTFLNKSAKWHCGRHTLICKKNSN